MSDSYQKRIVVLISGSGSNLQALIDSSRSPSLPGQIVLVISNRKAAYGLTRASLASPPIATSVLSLKTFLTAHPTLSRTDYDVALARLVREARPDLVVLAGFMHILSPEFLDLVHAPLDDGTAPAAQRFPIINLHPALPGAFDGAAAIPRALDAYKSGAVKGTGAMVHRVVADVDAGEPLIVREVEIKPDDTLEDLETRIHAVEHEIIVQGGKMALELAAEGRY
uniref:phosphoribosylglycinamide formyltransferase 1 n=1 Tax=Bartheletia paradoxa TaxID=669517 RepID=A0A2D0XHQ9_9BASI|nr:hypothetical protein SPAR05110 [Bartheletia paradoxa]